MKLKNFALAAMLVSSMSMAACTATGSVTTNPTASPSVSPSATTQLMFSGNLTGAQETPAVVTNATGTVTVSLSDDQKTATLNLSFQGLSSDQTGAHIHGPAAVGASAPVLISLANGQITNFVVSLTPEQLGFLKAGQLYVNVHTANNPNGEIRAQLTVK